MPRQARSSSYNAVTSTRRFYRDPEKEAFVRRDSFGEARESDSESSSDSSRGRPVSQRPRFGNPLSRRLRPSTSSKLRRPITRWLCLGLFTGLVLFILTLIRLSHNSSVPVPLAEKVAQKPPQWESFPFLKRYHGGIRTLVARKTNTPEYPGDELENDILSEDSTREENSAEQEPKADESKGKRDSSNSKKIQSSLFNPYPEYTSKLYVDKYGKKVDCFLDGEGLIRVPEVQYFDGVPKGFPEAVMGSNEMIGIQDDVCFDRFGKLGPYGFGYTKNHGGSGAGLEGDREGIEEVWREVAPVDFRKVNWANAQEMCIGNNTHRFKTAPPPRGDRFLSMDAGKALSSREVEPADSKSSKKDSTGDTSKDSSNEDQRLPRNAVLIRTWFDFHYTPEDIIYLRSLISELSINSGGEFTIYFLIHVKDNELPIWSDDETYQRVLRESLPEEFRGMGILWSEKQMSLMYGGLEDSFHSGLPVHGVYRSTFMPVQYFSHQHPEYDFVWNWEMDARYTGHYYQFFDKVGNWAKEQPRKLLWERNARFYVPSVHGSWDDFSHMVRSHTEFGTTNPNNIWSSLKKGADGTPAAGSDREGDKPVWGPERPADKDILEVEGEGIPPRTYEKDKYQWGVGEDADLIVFNPLYDPEGTTWRLRDDVTGYDKESDLPPRRTCIITASRLSRKLLATMHRETAIMHHSMFSEMWPATTALHHGFKAVYVPHSVYIDRRWPEKYLESVFNAGRNGASGGARTAIFGEREHNFRGTTFFYSAGFSPNLWRRWLGYRVDNDGGEEWELANEGRMCLPPMLLHPVKTVDMVIEDSPEVAPS